jgi:DNA-binding response OmpR family regulator
MLYSILNLEKMEGMVKQMNQRSDNNMQIMLIDQDKHVRDSLRLFFKEELQHFLIFKSASEGLNALKYQKIDIVIADYFLPDMNGLLLLKKIREDYPDTLRVLMATIVSDDLEKEIRQAHIDCFLEKPITIATLDSVLLKLSRKRQHHNHLSNTWKEK